VTVSGLDSDQMGALSFGVAELSRDFQDSRELLVRNRSSFPATFNVTVTKVSGVPHTVTVSSSTITVRGKDTANLRVKMEVPASTVGGTHDAQQNVLYEEAAGYVTLTPADSFSNGGVALRLPYYLVPRARSNVGAVLKNGKQLAVHVDNRNGVIAGNADFYVWGLRNQKSNTLQSGFEPRAIGVQSNVIPGADASTNDSVLVFAINTHGHVSNFGAGEYDILIDTTGDGKPDYILFSGDVGNVTAGAANGQVAAFLLNEATGALTEFPADAPTDGSIIELVVLASAMGVTPANPQFSYSVNAFDIEGNSESVPLSASFNAFTPALSNAEFVSVPPNAAGNIPVGVDIAQLRKTPALGFMVVTEDNTSGASEANLLSIPKN
jgi:minor extracellular serine protease Vpr